MKSIFKYYLPITVLLKHSDNLMQLEALLLGISGLLNNQFTLCLYFEEWET
jgi:hypothetical protein